MKNIELVSLGAVYIYIYIYIYGRLLEKNINLINVENKIVIKPKT